MAGVSYAPRMEISVRYCAAKVRELANRSLIGSFGATGGKRFRRSPRLHTAPPATWRSPYNAHRHFGLNAHASGQWRSSEWDSLPTAISALRFGILPSEPFFMQPINGMAVQGDFRCEQVFVCRFPVPAAAPADTKSASPKYNAFFVLRHGLI